ncbi:MAG: ABC transporter permease [Saprospiraceae bacterium]|nr:ABC transporter permease [Saprospiraceae bacterium]
MKQALAFIKKEFYHVLRDYRTILVLIGIPVVQIILFGFALSTEVKNTQVAVYDQSKDIRSQSLIEAINQSRYFDVIEEIYSEKSAEQSIRSGKVKMVIIFPPSFDSDLQHGNNSSVQLLTDGIDPNVASIVISYVSAIIQDHQNQWFNREKLPYDIEILTRMVYNPQLRGEYTFVPGVMALVLMLICALMTSVSIVKEKEMGNMEILLVSPLKPLTIVLSKTVPYLVLSHIILALILGLSVFLLGVPIKGSLILLLIVSFIFIITALSLGMLISSLTNSQQVAMMVSIIGLMLPTVMLSGFMFPIENMPTPLQLVSNLVPSKWFYYCISDIMIRGLGIEAVAKEVFILSGFAVFFLAISLKSFKTRLA